MKDRIEFWQTKKIQDYKPILQGLQDVFGIEHWPTILSWCGITDDEPEGFFGKYWEVWLFGEKNKTIGMCGLYSHQKHNSELWLGYFGVLPQYRNLGIGAVALEFMNLEAKKAGGLLLLTHVSDLDAARFYKKNGFDRVPHSIAEQHPDMAEYLNHKEDWVMRKTVIS